MIFTKTGIEGAFIIDLNKIEDERGFFGRSFCINEFKRNNIIPNIVQANISSNKKKGTLRGLHMQLAPFEETKIVRCTRGVIYDVLVDLRIASPTYLKWLGIELTSENFRMLCIPCGCAHGYLTLQDDTDVMYHVTEFYNPKAEVGFLWNDPAFKIEWPINPLLVSKKDEEHPLFNDQILKPI
jgi:dTDP-4-dehydrorhamnose 3,5-epimerase